MQSHSDDGFSTPQPNSDTLISRVKKFDENRRDFPGEHLVVFGLGALLMIAGMRSRTLLRGGLMTAVGTALIGRAASGTGGVAKMARMMKRLG